MKCPVCENDISFLRLKKYIRCSSCNTLLITANFLFLYTIMFLIMVPGIFPLIMVLSTGFVFLGFAIEGAIFYFLYKKLFISVFVMKEIRAR